MEKSKYITLVYLWCTIGGIASLFVPLIFEGYVVGALVLLSGYGWLIDYER